MGNCESEYIIFSTALEATSKAFWLGDGAMVVLDVVITNGLVPPLEMTDMSLMLESCQRGDAGRFRYTIVGS